jgi:hypothetical protein
MSKLAALAKVLKQIDGVSKKIIDKSLSIMKQLQDTESELIDDLIDAKGIEMKEEDTGHRAYLLEELQRASLTWTFDAESVKNEIGNFIIEEDDVYTVNADHDVCPFLTEVWNGDSYDKTGLEGLKSLLEDLNVQLKGITESNLIENVSRVL